MDDHLRYLALMGACLLVTLPLELFPGVRVWRDPRRVVRAVLPVMVVFVVWDLVGVLRGHWDYAARYLTGLDIGPLPVEELVFFVVVPLCTLLTWEAVGSVMRLVQARRERG